MAVGENSLNEGLSSSYITMGLSKLHPPSLCSINKDMNDNECTMGLLKPNVQSTMFMTVLCAQKAGAHDAEVTCYSSQFLFYRNYFDWYFGDRSSCVFNYGN